MKRIPSIDGLRAVAALLVIVSHGLLFNDDVWPYAVNPGIVGVRLFFVLSGALISGLLWTMKGAGGTFGQTWRRFAYRRALRIFPLAYFTMALAWWAGLPAMVEQPWAYLTFTNNLAAGVIAPWPDGLPHFWTLAIEEQIYLIWPALLLLIAWRAWVFVALGFALAAFGSRLMGWTHDQWPVLYLDAFALGSLIALSARHGCVRIVTRVCAGSGVGLVAFAWGYDDMVSASILETGLVCLTASVVGWAWQRPSQPVLSYGPLVWIGTMSYGVYVWHEAGPRILHQIGLPHVAFGVDMLALKMACGLGLAALTWYGFERPINRLKDRREISQTVSERRASIRSVHQAGSAS